MFRVTINDKPLNKDYGILGDRVLSGWVGKAAGGILHFPTYTYTNLMGAGVANVV
jgi:hypothetical protein